jgi:hypothetical protein
MEADVGQLLSINCVMSGSTGWKYSIPCHIVALEAEICELQDSTVTRKSGLKRMNVRSRDNVFEENIKM